MTAKTQLLSLEQAYREVFKITKLINSYKMHMKQAHLVGVTPPHAPGCHHNFRSLTFHICYTQTPSNAISLYTYKNIFYYQPIRYQHQTDTWGLETVMLIPLLSLN